MGGLKTNISYLCFEKRRHQKVHKLIANLISRAGYHLICTDSLLNFGKVDNGIVKIKNLASYEIASIAKVCLPVN